jgi:DNA modification methylase
MDNPKDASDRFSQNYGEHGLTSYDSTERYPIDILQFKWDTQKSKGHPTQKPVEANEYFIKTYTNAGDWVLDNTMGFGSSAIAAANLDRNYIGIELDDAIFGEAVKRFDERTFEWLKQECE